MLLSAETVRERLNVEKWRKVLVVFWQIPLDKSPALLYNETHQKSSGIKDRRFRRDFPILTEEEKIRRTKEHICIWLYQDVGWDTL